jgi:DNA-binding NarL/FixJ family response regulator
VRVAVADDSGLFRAGLVSVLTSCGVVVTAQAATASALLEQIAAEPPDAVVLDVRMPPTFTDEGLRAALDLRRSPDGPAVLLLSTYAEPDHAARLLDGPARRVGYLLKDRVDDPPALLDALERIVAGDVVVDTDLVTRLITHRRHVQALARLSGQERRVLQLIAEGRSNEGISSALHVTPKTVEAYIGRVFVKLDLGPAADDNRRVIAALTWLRLS